MSILDDAIREHLELKRAHGADETELKKLEDEAFGPPARPDQIDPFAEAPTEFLGVPEGQETPVSEPDEAGRRIPNIADLQEGPPPPKDEAVAAPAEEQPAAEQELPDPGLEADEADGLDEGEAPTSDASHTTAERDAIADQPTELFDVEAEMGPEPDTADQPSPTDEDIVDAELAGPRLAPVEDPALAHDHVEDDEDDDFFSEQRLSDELNQALEAPITEEHPVGESSLPVAEPEPHVPTEQDHEEQDSEEHQAPASDSGPDEHEDVLEDTPEFLEDTPEDDDLWFEQRPPKDFDFDD